MKILKNLINKYKQLFHRAGKNAEPLNYFEKAKSWADDIYTETIASRNRYRTALVASIFLLTGLIVVLIMLIPLEHTTLVIVHHAEDGTVWVEPLHQSYAPRNKAELEGEIVRYISNRESYSASSYHKQYSLVNLMSSSRVAKQYMHSQRYSNKHSYVNRFGNRGIRTVHIDNVIFLDKTSLNRVKHKSDNHHNLAQVNFVVTNHDKLTGKTTKKALLALVSWAYRGTPADPESKWRNWNGFTVTRYTIEQRNV